MEQEGDGRGGAGGEDNQRLKTKMMIQQGGGDAVAAAQVQVQVQVQPHQPQKCPRCDSLNTKFCYYNNYSLSQPRYFCKTCRRYWTHGGTLRNVPIGGGCRKGKRSNKNSPSSSSSSSSSSRSQPPPPSQEMINLQTQPNLTTVMRVSHPSPPPPFYQGSSGGYLSSLAAIHQSLNSPHPFDQTLNVVGGGDVAASSNLGLLAGFGAPNSLISSQHQIRPQQTFYQTGGGGGSRERGVVENLYTAAAEQGLNNVPSTMVNSSAAATRNDWPQNFINNNAAGNRASVDDASLWSTISTTTTSSGNNSQRNAGSSSSSALIPNQWPDLPGYNNGHNL